MMEMENSLLLNESSSYFVRLPIEILHRILDELDIKDILYSFRYVCKRFDSAMKIYNRLTLKLSDHSSEHRIDRLYKIISLENIGSLIIQRYNNNNELNDIDWFFKFGDINRFTRLRFVHLESMNENDFRTIMRHLTTLTTLSRFQSLKIFDRRIFKNDTIILLSNVIALPTLRKLHLDISSRIIDQILWPNDSTFQELILNKCSYKQWCDILHHSPNLRICSTADLDMNNMGKIVTSMKYCQLTSLALNDIRFLLDQLETVLLSYPSLIYFSFTSSNNSSFENLRRFSTWENFLRENLPRLKNFHFKISAQISRYEHLSNIKSIIAAFRTPFWIKDKCWYAKFQYVSNNEGSRFVIQSSINGHVDFFQSFENGFMLYFTSTTKNDNGPKMPNQWNAIFNLPEIKQAISFRQFYIPNDYLFDNVIRLGLDIDCYEDWQRSGSFELLSKLINFSQLKDVWFLLSCKQTLQASEINTILEKAHNVRTFGITNNGSLRDNFELQCADISNQINHLTIRSSDTSTMLLTLEHVQHLSTITFMCDWSSSTTWTKMIKYLQEKEMKFSITDDYRSIQIWNNE